MLELQAVSCRSILFTLAVSGAMVWCQGEQQQDGFRRGTLRGRLAMSGLGTSRPGPLEILHMGGKGQTRSLRFPRHVWAAAMNGVSRS